MGRIEATAIFATPISLIKQAIRSESKKHTAPLAVEIVHSDQSGEK